MNEEELIHATRNIPKEPKQRLIRDAALGVATAKCLISRMMGKDGLSAAAHPYPCRICKIPTEDIWPIYQEWMQWSMLEEPDGDVPTEVERFMRMSAEDQRRLVYEMQGYQEGPDGKPLPPDEKATGTQALEGQTEPLGERDGAGDGGGRRQRRSTTPAGTERGRRTDRGAEAPPSGA